MIYNFFASSLEARATVGVPTSPPPALSTSSTSLGKGGATAAVGRDWSEGAQAGVGQCVLLLSFADLKSLLVDFEVFPQVVNSETLLSLYRGVKVWEWQVYDSAASQDILGLGNGANNISLTLIGFVELLSRLALVATRLDASASRNAIAYLMRIMNEGKGRGKLLTGYRKSVALRTFVI